MVMITTASCNMRMRADDMVDASARRVATFAIACGAAYVGATGTACVRRNAALSICPVLINEAMQLTAHGGDSEQLVVAGDYNKEEDPESAQRS